MSKLMHATTITLCLAFTNVYSSEGKFLLMSTINETNGTTMSVQGTASLSSGNSANGNPCRYNEMPCNFDDTCTYYSALKYYNVTAPFFCSDENLSKSISKIGNILLTQDMTFTFTDTDNSANSYCKVTVELACHQFQQNNEIVCTPILKKLDNSSCGDGHTCTTDYLDPTKFEPVQLNCPIKSG